MNKRTLNPFARTEDSDADGHSTIIDLVSREAVKRHPWLRALGFGVFGGLGLLCLFVLARLLLVNYLQGEMLSPLGRVVRRLDLSSGAARLVWYATFGCSAASLTLVFRRLCHLLLPLKLFRLTMQENVLLTCLFAAPLLAPDVAKKVFPVHEVNPATEAWFDEAEDGGTQPHGLIGFVREENGGWWFGNVRGGPRPSDGAPISPVTREIRREWQSWVNLHHTEEAEKQRAGQEQHRRQTAAAEARTAQELAEARRKGEAAQAERSRTEPPSRFTDQASGRVGPIPKAEIESETPAIHTPNRMVLLNEPVRMVQPGEVPGLGLRCNRCGQPPTSHFWLNGSHKCPLPGGLCRSCGQPVRFHRHLRESVDGVVRDRIACQK